MDLPIICHPILLFLYSNLIVTTTAAFTARDSPLRYAALGALFLLSLVSVSAVSQFTKTTGWAGRVPTGAMFWNCVTCLDRLILRSWDYHHYRPTRNLKEKMTGREDDQFSGSRMDFGSEVSGLARGVGRFWQVKHVPYFANTNPAFVPSVGAFVLVQVSSILLLYSEYIPLFSTLPDVSASELWTRAVASIGYWIVQYCNMQFFYSLFALLSVPFSPHDIKLWRPLFGDPSDAYTLRNFWGKSWHQTLRSGLEGVSNFLTHDVMHLPSQGILQRYTKIFFSFALSGIMHIFADTGGGLAMKQSGALQFFCMQALGITIEDGVQEIYKWVIGRKAGLTPSMSERIIGYTWVVLFLIWTSPVWVFPATLQMRKEEAMLSLSALKTLIRGLTS